MNQRKRFTSTLIACVMSALMIAAPIHSQDDSTDVPAEDDVRVLIDDDLIRVVYMTGDGAADPSNARLWSIEEGHAIDVAPDTGINAYLTGAWSSDCVYFAFGGTRSAGMHRLYRIDMNSAAIMPISPEDIAYHAPQIPVWSPLVDAHQIVYIYSAGTTTPATMLDIVDTDSGSKQSYLIASGSIIYSAIVWWDATNQVLIQVAMYHGETLITNLYQLDLNASDPQPQQLDLEAVDPSVSVNVAPLTREVTYETHSWGSGSIWLNGTDIADTQALGRAIWSPDGTHLLYANQDRNRIVVDAATGTSTNVTAGLDMQQLWGYFAGWWPDGTRIYWWSSQGVDTERYTQFQSVSAEGGDYRVHWRAYLPNLTLIPFACILPQDNE